jgi:predicted dehydrogenase
MRNTRRNFVKKIGLGSAALTLGNNSFGFNARSYSQIQGSNMKLNFAVAGVNSRGKAHIKTLLDLPNTSVGYICDVDTRAAEAAAAMVEKQTGKRPKIYDDVRKLLEEKDLDALTIATPDHWHAPMTILAVKAGKHVYVEKPVCHNLHEAELLKALSKKYNKVVQYGAQGRSGVQNAIGMKDLKDGLIGDVYLAKTWYITKRPSIGTGQKTAVPDWLNWDLFQGPAPREDYRDNIVPYNWHWFEKWGTGEVGNNGVHVLDSCRWGLGVDYPEKVTSYGGRYMYKDDWQFCDTQNVSYKFSNGKTVMLEIRCCNNFPMYEGQNGIVFFGTNGTIRINPESDRYIAYGPDNKIIKEFKGEELKVDDRVGYGNLNGKHFGNWLDVIRDGAKQNAPIDQGAISTSLCLLGNISQKLGRTITLSPEGKILNDKEGTVLSSRKYESGWEPKV